MPYIPTDWKNLPSTDTPINAENLNKIEEALTYILGESVTNMDFTSASQGNIGSGVFFRKGNVVQMTATIYVEGVYSDTKIGELPDGFRGVMDTIRSVTVVDGNGLTTGYVRYNYSTNEIFLTTSTTSPSTIKFSNTYLTLGAFVV